MKERVFIDRVLVPDCTEKQVREAVQQGRLVTVDDGTGVFVQITKDNIVPHQVVKEK